MKFKINSLTITTLLKFSAVFLLIVQIVHSVRPSLVQAQITDPTDEPPLADLSLAIDPPVTYLHVKPSEVITHTVMVTNTGSKTLTVTVNVTDFKPDGITGQPILQPGQVFNKQANPDLSFGEPFTIAPNENHSVTLQFDVAQLANQKEYPLAILFNARSIDDEGNKNSSGAQVAGTITSNLILFISDSDENQGRLAINRLTIPKIIDSFGGIHFSILAENNGANATPINGQVTIKNIFLQKINEYLFYPDYILASSTRLVRGTELSEGIINNEGKLDPEKIEVLTTNFVYKAPFMFGLYTVDVEVGQHQRTTSVIAIPFSLLILVGVGGLIYVGYNKIKKEL